MAATIAKLSIKKSLIEGLAPEASLLDYGELAINYADGKLYYKDNLNVIRSIGDPDAAILTATQTFSGANTFEGNTIFSSTVSFNDAVEFTAHATFKSVEVTATALTDGTGIVWDATDGNIATVTLTQNSTLTEILNAGPGTYVLRVIQDGTGGWSLDFGTNFESVDGTVFEPSLVAGATTIITILNLGDDSFYVVGLKNFSSFGTISPPLMIGTTEYITITGGSETWINGDYIQIPDINGQPAWEYLDYSGSPVYKSVISSPTAVDQYQLDVSSATNPGDPMITPTPSAYIVTGWGDPTTTAYEPPPGSPYTGTPTPTASVTIPDYLGTAATVAVGYEHLVGLTTEFFQQADTYDWYGTDPIPAGSVYRAPNLYLELNSQSHIYIAPRNNDVNGDWVLGLLIDPGVSNSLFEFAYLTGGPLGTYVGGDWSTTVTAIV